MTTKDKWIGGVGFVSLLLICTIMFYAPIALMAISMWFFPIFAICLTIVTFGVVLWLPKYMRTWQDWANNVKKFAQIS